MTTKPEGNRIPALDVMRGAACLAVIFHHTSFLGPKPFLPWYANVALSIPPLLWTGVDFFFVLSGFLITSLLLEAKLEAKNYFRNFYARRILRLVPVYYAVLAIVTVLAGLQVRDMLPPDWRMNTLYWFNLPNIASLLEEHGSAFSPSWSLGVEEFFYLMWSVLVFVLPIKPLRIILMLIIAMSPVMRWALYGVFSGHFIYVFTFTRMDGLALGCLIATVWKQDAIRLKLSAISRWATPMFGFSILLYLALGGSAELTSLSALTIAIPLVNLFAASLLVYLASVGSVSLPVLVPLLMLAGRLSYSAYLLHEPVITAIQYWNVFPFGFLHAHHANVAIVQLLYTGLVAIITFSISLIFWNTFESRILRLKSKF